MSTHQAALTPTTVKCMYMFECVCGGGGGRDTIYMYIS